MDVVLPDPVSPIKSIIFLFLIDNSAFLVLDNNLYRSSILMGFNYFCIAIKLSINRV
jgi:hypothetical protein